MIYIGQVSDIAVTLSCIHDLQHVGKYLTLQWPWAVYMIYIMWASIWHCSDLELYAWFTSCEHVSDIALTFSCMHDLHHVGKYLTLQWSWGVCMIYIMWACIWHCSDLELYTWFTSCGHVSDIAVTVSCIHDLHNVGKYLTLPWPWAVHMIFIIWSSIWHCSDLELYAWFKSCGQVSDIVVTLSHVHIARSTVIGLWPSLFDRPTWIMHVSLHGTSCHRLWMLSIKIPNYLSQQVFIIIHVDWILFLENYCAFLVVTSMISYY